MPFLKNLHDFLRRKECPYTQFVKYVICGGISVVADMTVFYLLAWLVFPCLKPGDPVVELIEMLGFSIHSVSPETLMRNYWIIKGFCFVVSNIVVYILNILYVFESGKHRAHHEIMLFFLISLVVFLVGTGFGAVLIGKAGWHITYTYAFILTVSVAANYLLRKFIVFKR